MDLTKPQIEIIKNYVEKHLNYADLKLEVLDHLILDVENFMHNKNTLFEEAFHLTTLKWNKTLKKSFHIFYFGTVFSAPKIVLNKAIKSWRFYFLGYLAIYFLPFLLKSFPVNFDKEFITIFNNTIHTLTLVAFIVFNFIWFRSVFSKIKTSYSFVIKTLVFMNAFYLLSFFRISLFTDSGEIQFAFMSFAFAGIYMAIISVIFYKKHVNSIQSNSRLT